MTVQGNLGTIGQGSDNLLRSILREKLTGRLSIFYENEKKRNVQDVIFIEQGVIIGLKSLDKYSIKELLIYAGKVSKETVAGAIAKAKASGGTKTAEQVLLDEGVITREKIIHAIATLIRGCIQRILTKPYGLYIFHPSDQLKGVRAMTRISILQTILDYSRAQKKPDIFDSLVPSIDSLAELTINVEDIRKKYHLTEEEWKVIFLVNGERSLARIFQDANLTEERGRKLVYSLLMVDFIRLNVVMPAGMPTSAPTGVSTASGTMPPPAPSSTSPGIATYASNMPPPPSSMTSTAPPRPMTAPASRGAAFVEEEEAPRETRGTILVVDDSKTIQKMVELALKTMPYKLVMADDGYMALERAQECSPDLVILDVIMPKLDGYKTCSQLKKVFAPRKVPVIMLTARDGAFDKIKGRLAGASMYMAKPFEGEELQRAVSKFMEGSA